MPTTTGENLPPKEKELFDKDGPEDGEKVSMSLMSVWGFLSDTQLKKTLTRYLITRSVVKHEHKLLLRYLKQSETPGANTRLMMSKWSNRGWNIQVAQLWAIAEDPERLHRMGLETGCERLHLYTSTSAEVVMDNVDATQIHSMLRGQSRQRIINGVIHSDRSPQRLAGLAHTNPEIKNKFKRLIKEDLESFAVSERQQDPECRAGNDGHFWNTGTGKWMRRSGKGPRPCLKMLLDWTWKFS